jgi:hypothetical protein
LEQIKLNKENPEIEFKLKSNDSYLLIHSVFITSPKNFENEWTNFILKVKLTAELRHVVFVDPEGRFIFDRIKPFPIHLLVDPYQVQPIFQLNKLIKNETIKIGINTDLNFYRKLKLELKDYENLDSNHTLEFNIEKFKIDD